MSEIIFSRKNSKYEILNHLSFGPNFVFGTVLERFSQCFFLIFGRRPTVIVEIFTQSPTIETSYGTVKKTFP